LAANRRVQVGRTERWGRRVQRPPVGAQDRRDQAQKEVRHTDGDIEHIKRVNGYVKRHLGQGPKNDAENSKWRYSLMNWGHDPLK
jgi:Protein of unknown function (DUF3140)